MKLQNPFTRNQRLNEDHAVRKQFNYTKDGCKLDFTLRIDIKKELSAFRDLMSKALEDIETELSKLP